VARVIAIAALGLAACAGKGEAIGYTALSTTWRTSGELEGARADAYVGYHGVQFGVAPFWERLARADSPTRSNTGGLDVQLRLSLLGILADDHRFEHWLDFGGEAGAGGGITDQFRLSTFGHAWAGGWAAVGLWNGPSYPELVLGIRTVTSTAPWTGETLFTVGFGWMKRTDEPVGFFD
jgi:hypothetical protein